MKPRNVVLCVLLTVPAGCAERELRVEALPYYGYTDYGSGSAKSRAHFTGLYAALEADAAHRVEAEVDSSRITYRTGAVLDQTDATLVYTHLGVPNWRLRAGAHYLDSPGDPTDDGWVVMAGVHHVDDAQRRVGLDLYASHYNDYDPALTVWQLTPQVALPVWRHAQASVWANAKGHAIRLSDDVGGDGQTFLSAEGRLDLYVGDWSAGLFGWAGEQAFAVRNDGFVVYNLSEKHTGGYGVDLTRALGERTWLTVRVQRELFEDFYSQDDTGSVSVVLMLRHTF